MRNISSQTIASYDILSFYKVKQPPNVYRFASARVGFDREYEEYD